MVSQSAWVTPSGLSIEILKKRFFPPPFSSISTISIPSDWATRWAMASIFATIGLLMLAKTLESNKKVGFRPLQEFDTYNLNCSASWRKRNLQGRMLDFGCWMLVARCGAFGNFFGCSEGGGAVSVIAGLTLVRSDPTDCHVRGILRFLFFLFGEAGALEFSEGSIEALVDAMFPGLIARR